MKRIKLSILAFLLFATFGLVKAEDKKVVSPDGKLVVSVSAENGVPGYTVTLNGKQFLQQSPLGLNTNVGDLTQGLSMNEEVSYSKVDEIYELPTALEAE